MNKTLLRTKFRNKFLKNRIVENKENNVKQRNLLAPLLRKMRREYYINLDEKNFCDNETF